MPQFMPYLTVDNCAKAIDYYCHLLAGNQEGEIAKAENGLIMNVSIKVGDQTLMLMDEFEGSKGFQSPKTLGGTTVMTFINMSQRAEVDEIFSRITDETEIMKPDVMFWGAYYGQFKDRFGHIWGVGSPA